MMKYISFYYQLSSRQRSIRVTVSLASRDKTNDTLLHANTYIKGKCKTSAVLIYNTTFKVPPVLTLGHR